MNNDTLKASAQALIQTNENLVRAERNHEECYREVTRLRNKKSEVEAALMEYVGANVPRRVILCEALVVLVENEKGVSILQAE